MERLMIFYFLGFVLTSGVGKSPLNVEVHAPQNDAFKIVCYYSVLQESFRVDLPDPPLDVCTHIIVGFAVVLNSSLTPQNQGDLDIYMKIIAMKQYQPGLQILISLGGGTFGTDDFLNMISSENERQKFASSVANFTSLYGFDGFDIDWEFPAWDRPFIERFQFVSLLAALRKALDQVDMGLQNRNAQKLLTLAVAAPEIIIDRSYRIQDIVRYVNFINVMAYDYHIYKWYFPFTAHNAALFPHHNELFFLKTLNLNSTVHYWLDLGMPPSKLVVGIPTYGQTYKLLSSNWHTVYAPAVGPAVNPPWGQISYGQVCQHLKSSDAKKYWDRESAVPYAAIDRMWISYENEKSAGIKVDWAKRLNLAGVMVFSINVDDFANVCGDAPYPILHAIWNAVNN